MSVPRSAEEGGADLLSIVSSEEEIYQVIIRSRDMDEQVSTIEARLEHDLGLTIPPERTLYYTPPRSVDDKRIGHSYYPREESVPVIEDLTKTYLLADNLFETGGTLNCAIGALERQGVPRDNIWFLVTMIIDSEGSRKEMGYLDRADVFVRYREENPIRD